MEDDADYCTIEPTSSSVVNDGNCLLSRMMQVIWYGIKLGRSRRNA